MSKRSDLPGINIQFPISREILSGRKTVETRTYAIPKKFVGQPLAMIETPGDADFDARIVAIVTFGESFPYKTAREFYADILRHRVDRKSRWKWTREKPKWGWPIIAIKKLPTPTPAPKRKGIVFTSNCKLVLEPAYLGA